MDQPQRHVENTQVHILLASDISRGWASTSKRGRPEKFIVPFQAPVINEPGRVLPSPIVQPTVVRKPLDLPPKKRNLELLQFQGDDAHNHSSLPNKLIILRADPNVEPSNKGKDALVVEPSNKGKDVLVVEDGSSEAHERPVHEAPKPHICCTCGKWFDTYFALGGHRSNHKRKENKLRRANPLLAAIRYGQRIETWTEPIPMPPRRNNMENECEKCKRRFTKRQGLAAHSRFCRKRGNQQRFVQDFDLNLLPAEAFLPNVIHRFLT